MITGGKRWVMFTKRTNDPKLSWLEGELLRAGIPSRRNGESFHAPILEVRKCDEERAWEILEPVDEMKDDHPRFVGCVSPNDFERHDCSALIAGFTGISSWQAGRRSIAVCLAPVGFVRIPRKAFPDASKINAFKLAEWLQAHKRRVKP
ncbi:hypothetical protein [Thiocapsa sp. N5-Cardenillas]|uniref:hypothetical protein n=1 Tax=Thiocapsa sp. N5-Cardenillas TaxID=3137397 RepID=UPI0035ADADF0